MMEKISSDRVAGIRSKLRKKLKKLVIGTSFEDMLRNFFTVKLRIRIVNFIFQRFFRINSDVPWSVHYTSIVEVAEKIKIGKNVRKSFAVSGNVYIQAFNGIEIGDDTIFGPGAKIISTNHDEVSRKSTTNPPVRIGKRCWIGANAVILPGVVLGDNVIVAAGAVVSKSFPANMVLAGVPASVIRQTKTYQKKD